MWDPEQIATMIVTSDRLQAEGDPLGEWLALRLHLDRGSLSASERQTARERATRVREQLGDRLILARDLALGRPNVIREQGWIAGVALESATPSRLAALLARPDAAMVLRLRLRSDIEGLLGCVELLLEDPALPARACLRTLDLELAELQPEAHEQAQAELDKQLYVRHEQLGAALPELFMLVVDDRDLPLPWLAAAEGDAGEGAWSARERTTIGRALADPRPDLRLHALERLSKHARFIPQLRVPLLRRVTHEPSRVVRQRALGLIERLGTARTTLLAHLGDWAREHDDFELRRWLRELS